MECDRNVAEVWWGLVNQHPPVPRSGVDCTPVLEVFGVENPENFNLLRVDIEGWHALMQGDSDLPVSVTIEIKEIDREDSTKA